MSWRITSTYFSSTTEPIVTDGLVLRLDAGNRNSYPGSGTTWTDLSGNGNNGTLTNGPTYSSSNGGSLSFDGVNDYVVTSPMSLSGALTFSFWIKGNVKDGNDHVFIDTSSSSWGGEIGIMNFGNSLTLFGVPFSGNVAVLDASSTIMTGNWINIVVTQTASTNATITSYLNGNFGTQKSLTNAISSTNTAVNIGRRSDNLVFYGGNIAQVSIYNRALTASEVQQNYDALKYRFQ
jgi:hypothetical protein